MIEWQNRELDIEEILSRDYSPNVIIDAYEYCMRKCSWDVSQMQNSTVKVFLLCIIFQGEVENGGITQFLSNSSGNMTSETIDALKRIDEVYADLLIKAAHCFPEGIVPKKQERYNG